MATVATAVARLVSIGSIVTVRAAWAEAKSMVPCCTVDPSLSVTT